MIIHAVSAKEAADICGFRSVAMLDYLQRSGVFVRRRDGGRRGRGRRYEFRDLLILKTISALLQNGASVASLKQALVEFQGRKWRADFASLQSDEGTVMRYMVACGNRIYFAKSADNLFELTAGGQLAFSFVIDLDRLHTDLCFQLSQRELPLSQTSLA